MSRRSALSFLFALVSFVATGESSGGAQQLQVASRGPRFIVAGTSLGMADASGAVVLHRRVTLDLNGVSTDEALKEITRQADLEITYSPRVVALERRVSLHARDITVAAALTEVLLEAGVDVSVTTGGQLALVRRALRPAPVSAVVDTGAVAGRVTDAESGAPLGGATVTIEGTRRSATTDAEGRYRIGGVAPGTHTVRARYVGYAPLVASVAVSAGAEVTLDFSLEKSVPQLEEVVTTGTVLPTKVKAVPTPISVITAADIAARHPRTMQELLRQTVPTAVSFDLPGTPAQTTLSVRGTSSLASGGQMKIFVDGIEASSFSRAAVDPKSVERIEVVRGPQAATLYGSDAAGGVIQIFTKRGDTALDRPQVEAEAALGMAQTPYDGFGDVLRQNYSAALRSGISDVSYNVGGGYSRMGDYVPNGEVSRQSIGSVYAGTRFARGMLIADLSARYYSNKLPSVDNPLLLETGFPDFSRPNFQPRDFTNETVGARVGLSPTNWWHNQLTLGVDRAALEIVQTRPRLTTPDDTLLAVFVSASRKTSLGYNTSVSGALAREVVGSLIVGFDHYSLHASAFNTNRALNTEGTIQTDPAGARTDSRTVITNTGYFAQIQFNVRDAVFLTGGLRAEENSTFGSALGTPVLPRIGLSFFRPIGQASIKLRGSWGRAIRAPQPGQSFEAVGPTQITRANPLIGPERQRGWDAGIDVVFSKWGSFSATAFDQTADDLIMFVQLPTTGVPIGQFQNVGRVSNTGVELEGAVNVGRLQVKAQYGYVRSRIEELGPSFTGDFQVGDRPLGIPAHTAGAALTFAPADGTTLNAGLTYYGSYRELDILGLASCFGGTGPCQPSFRDFTVDYPGFTKVNANVTQRITRQVSGFVSVDNLTNSHAHEGSNAVVVMGRITSVGVQLRY